jgi:acyl carrier protein
MFMNSNQKLYKAFSFALNIPLGEVTDELAYKTIPEWDSLGHMALVAELELVFDIMLDTDDILDLSSVAKAKEILSKYHVDNLEW